MDNDIFKGRGLIGRFLYSYPTSRIGTRTFNGKPIPYAYEMDYKKLIYDLLDIPCTENPTIINLSNEALELIKSEFSFIEERLINDFESITEWAGKYVGAVYAHCRAITYSRAE